MSRKFKVFIDGEAGTTGLQINARLKERADIELISIPQSLRKSSDARAEALNDADAAILCLPDEAAKEALSLISNPRVRVIDASTAHRVAAGWVYGFPEMCNDQRNAIAGSTRVANPGCLATGVISLLRPIIAAGLLPAEYPVTVNSVSGYSGGGKTLITEFEEANSHDAVRIYGLPLVHKHLPEIRKYSGLLHSPVLSPSVGRYAQGMIVDIPLQLWSFPGSVTPRDLHETLSEAYEESHFVEVVSEEEVIGIQEIRTNSNGYIPTLDPESLNGTNRMLIFVFGNKEGQQARLTAVFDNLGKGAAGAAIQNLNLMLGLDECVGL